MIARRSRRWQAPHRPALYHLYQLSAADPRSKRLSCYRLILSFTLHGSYHEENLSSFSPIFRRIWDTSKFEGFFPFIAGPARAAMPLPTFVATPGISVGYLQGRSKLDNLMLAKMHERGF